jgi:hypothetical protein
MNVLALVGQLGHALVSWGLGAADEGAPEAPAGVLCPVIQATPAAPSLIEASPAAMLSARATSPGLSVVRATAEC